MKPRCGDRQIDCGQRLERLFRFTSPSWVGTVVDFRLFRST